MGEVTQELTDRAIAEHLKTGAFGLEQARAASPTFAKAFFEDEALLLRIYSPTDLPQVYKLKAKAMLAMDLFDETENIRPPRTPNEAARCAHLVLHDLIYDTKIEAKKILTHMGIPHFPITDREQLKVIMAHAGNLI